MRRTLPAVLAFTILLFALPAAADPGHERPRITTFKFNQPPLKAGINETLTVIAHDPNSWISEVQVQYEDENGERRLRPRSFIGSRRSSRGPTINWRVRHSSSCGSTSTVTARHSNAS